MKKRAFNHRKQWSVMFSPPDELHPSWSGDHMVRWAKLFAPKPDEIREMLLELREDLGWSQHFAAAVLGVTRSAIAKWEGDERTISGSAAKLIVFLHSRLVRNPDLIKNPWDLAFSGRIPCRGSVQEAVDFVQSLELEPTICMSQEEMATLEKVQEIEAAAHKGDAKAQLLLGHLYSSGEYGKPQDMGIAALWYQRAAEQGNADAQFPLGARYANGEGVEKNLTIASKWLTLAAAQGHEKAKSSLIGLNGANSSP